MADWEHVGSEDPDMRLYARLLFKDFRLEITDEDRQRWQMLAREIFSNPAKRGGRPPQKIYYDVRSSILERGVRELTGWHHNDGYDQNDANSYNHDLFNGRHKFEVKRFKKGWWSWDVVPGKKRTAVTTLERNCHLIDFVICGGFEFNSNTPGEEEYVDLGYHLILRAPTFQRFYTKGDKDSWYYKHTRAADIKHMREWDQYRIDDGLPPIYKDLHEPQAIYRKLRD